MRGARLVVALVALQLGSGCLMTRYLSQGAAGQLDLLGKGEDIDKVIADPDTPLRTAMLLAAIPEIKAYGRTYGLSIRRNYKRYVQLDRPAAVWFVGAADPLAFKPLRWCFPIVGCFAGLGWFSEDDAVAQYLELENRGYDVIVRPAGAYSTGGWFPDPVLSTMLGGGDSAYPGLANVILHESVHATVLIRDQPFFNESLASYIANQLTEHWVDEHFGRGSPEELAWRFGSALRLPRAARTLTAYRALKKLYASKLPRDKKLAEKARIIDELVADLRLRKRPNNASLTEVRVYNGGMVPLIEAHRACGDLRKLVLAARTLQESDFQRKLQDDLKPIGKVLAARCKTLKP
jgi:predicted aminopeptidase